MYTSRPMVPYIYKMSSSSSSGKYVLPEDGILHTEDECEWCVGWKIAKTGYLYNLQWLLPCCSLSSFSFSFSPIWNHACPQHCSPDYFQQTTSTQTMECSLHSHKENATGASTVTPADYGTACSLYTA